MKLFAKLAIVLVLAGVAFSADNRLTIAVSLPPYAKMVKEIGGSYVNVISLLPPGADPHTYEPKPATLKAFSLAKVYFTDSSGMDAAWMPRFKGVNKNVEVVSIGKKLEWLEMEEHHHHDGDHHEHMHGDDSEEMDPHVWTSPKKAMQIAQNIYSFLAKYDHAHSNYYALRFQSMYEKIYKMDKKIRFAVTMLPKNRRTFIVFHPAYGYFANDYKLQQLTVEVNGKEPKPRDLSKLIKEGKEHDVHVVFVQPQFSKRSAEVIAKQLNAIVVETDPLAEDYLGNSEKLIDTITKSSEK